MLTVPFIPTLVAVITLTSIQFMASEYTHWTNHLACTDKCRTLGCKSGELIFSEHRQMIGCRCNSKTDYLVLLN